MEMVPIWALQGRKMIHSPSLSSSSSSSSSSVQGCGEMIARFREQLMCRKQVEQQDGGTSEYHTCIIHCLSVCPCRSWQSFSSRSTCQHFTKTFLFFLSRLYFSHLQNLRMEKPFCLWLHGIPAKFGQCLFYIFNWWTLGRDQVTCSCTELDGDASIAEKFRV